MTDLVVIAHNIRSIHNIGSIFRTAEGFGIKDIVCSGYTPYPSLPLHDNRLPHIHEKITNQMHKTALGAEKLVKFRHCETPPIETLRNQGYKIIGLEQNESSIKLPNYRPHNKIALILGEEVDGISQNILMQCDYLLEIPMFGKKESFNVSVAAGIALYHLTLL